MLEVRIHIPPHDRWNEIGLNMGFIELYQFADNKIEVIYPVNNFSGESIIYKLDEGFEKTLVFTEQRHQVVTAIKVNIEDFFVTNSSDEFFLSNLYENEEIYLPDPISIEDGFVYLIDITLDLNSIVEIDSSTLDFHPSFEIEMLQR